MKLMNKFYAFGAMIIVAFMVGVISYFVTQGETKNVTDVNGTTQYFPMKLSDGFELFDAKLDEYEITVYIRNSETGEIYESTLPSDEIESLVCENEYAEYYDAMEKGWDCSTEDKAVKSMIKEVAEQTIDIIKEDF